MIPLSKRKAVGILEEHGKSTEDAETYYDFMDANDYMLIEDAGGLIPVPKGVESLDEQYCTGPKDHGCFWHDQKAVADIAQGVPEGGE